MKGVLHDYRTQHFLSTALYICMHPCSVLNIADVQLHRDVEAVQEISSKHHGVNRGVDSMNPS